MVTAHPPSFILKRGIALIITITILSALITAGLAFLFLLGRDQAVVQQQSAGMKAESAFHAAVNSGIWEIREQLSQVGANGPYAGSTIEINTNQTANSLSFTNIIRTTNAAMNAYMNAPEYYHVLHHLGDEVEANWLSSYSGGDFSNDVDALRSGLILEGGRWQIVDLPELTKVAPSSFYYETLTRLSPYLTTHPQAPRDLIVNIIDYGICSSANNNNPPEFTAQNRNFQPGAPSDSLAGAYLEIIAGPGQGQVKQIMQTLNATTFTVDSPWNPLPNTQSAYRIFSRVSPINFNAAELPLLLANFRALKVFTNNVDLAVTKIQLENLRSPAPAGPTTRYIDYADFETNFLNTALGLGVVDRSLIQKLMNPNQPKGIENGAVMDIYPPPLLFVFQDDGYFTMNIESGTRTTETAPKPEVTILRTAIVKLKGTHELALRSDFEGKTSGKANEVLQHWVTTNDWVPVRHLNDLGNWKNIYRSNFDTYTLNGVAAHPEVIPDAVKTGLYFNFNEAGDGRPMNIIYDALSRTYTNARTLYSCFMPVTGASGTTGQIQPNTLPLAVSGPSGANALPDTKVAYSGRRDINAAPTAKEMASLDFGDIAVVSGMGDPNPAFFLMPHPPQVATWYDLTFPVSGNYATHVWFEHTLETLAGIDRTYPPKPWFTPSLYLRDDGTDLISWVAEYSYDDGVGVDYNDGGTGTCLPGPVYQTGDNYSVTFTNNFNNRYASPVIANYDPNPDFFSLVYEQGGSQHIETRINQIGFNESQFTNPGLAILGNSGALPANIATSGSIGFRRYFPGTGPATQAGFYHPSQSAPFTVDYLRIIAGHRNDGNGSTPDYPTYIAPVIKCPNGEKIQTVTLSYRTGLRRDTANGFIAANDTFRVNLQLDLKSNVDPSVTALYDIAAWDWTGNQNLLIDHISKTEGQLTFTPDLALNNLENCALQITIGDDASNPTERSAFLKTTLAITRIVVNYSISPMIVDQTKG